MDNKTLYKQDFYLWIRTTINQLQARQFDRVDLENLLEELASMGRSEKRTIENLLIQLLVNLLKLTYWTRERSRNQGHWQGEIRNFRRQILREIKDSPSLKPYILEIFEECYQFARKETQVRTQLPLDTFPAILIGSLEQILDEDWFPVGNNLEI
jgi:hypothetical protein